MEPILSNVPAAPRNVPRDLQSRLYREIGISAVAAALQVGEFTAKPGAPEKREHPAARHAA